MTAIDLIVELNEVIELTPEMQAQILTLNQEQIDEIAEQLIIETSPAKLVRWLIKKLKEYSQPS